MSQRRKLHVLDQISGDTCLQRPRTRLALHSSEIRLCVLLRSNTRACHSSCLVLPVACVSFQFVQVLQSRQNDLFTRLFNLASKKDLVKYCIYLKGSISVQSRLEFSVVADIVMPTL